MLEIEKYGDLCRSQHCCVGILPDASLTFANYTCRPLRAQQDLEMLRFCLFLPRLLPSRDSSHVESRTIASCPVPPLRWLDWKQRGRWWPNVWTGPGRAGGVLSPTPAPPLHKPRPLLPQAAPSVLLFHSPLCHENKSPIYCP